ncbi:MAG: AI-2E family transporter [Chthonomonadales bacterium]|nr:AI-2E family transporter [Chthonomonadales bacterium]
MDPERIVTVRNLRSLVVWALVAYLVYVIAQAIAQALLIFGVALFAATVLDGPIRYLDRHGLSRASSVAIILLLVVAGAAVVIAVSARPIMLELRELTTKAPAYGHAIERRVTEFAGQYPFIGEQLANGDVSRSLSNLGKTIASGLGRFSVGILGGLFAAVLIFVTALYAVVDPKPLVRGIVMAAPRRYQRVTLRIVVGVSDQIQAWARATLWLMVIVGVACGLGLWAIGVRSALLFGVLAGIGEAIPTIGPILTAIPPALVAFADEPMKAVWVLLLFLVVQQLEQHLLVPRIMAAALKLHPVSVLFFVVALGGILGPLGVLLATPLAAAVKVAHRELRADARRQAENTDPPHRANPPEVSEQ